MINHDLKCDTIVKPVLRGHHWEKEKWSFLDRPLNTGLTIVSHLRSWLIMSYWYIYVIEKSVKFHFLLFSYCLPISS
jgi:hypothetical protein